LTPKFSFEPESSLSNCHNSELVDIPTGQEWKLSCTSEGLRREVARGQPQLKVSEEQSINPNKISQISKSAKVSIAPEYTGNGALGAAVACQITRTVTGARCPVQRSMFHSLPIR
jgi:hypothetical protein